MNAAFTRTVLSRPRVCSYCGEVIWPDDPVLVYQRQPYTAWYLCDPETRSYGCRRFCEQTPQDEFQVVRSEAVFRKPSTEERKP